MISIYKCLLILEALSLVPTVVSQSSQCYATVDSLNTDIQIEVAGIQAGGAPLTTYLYRLCPNTNLDILGESLTPLLDGSVFQCGDTGNPLDNCRIVGGVNQVDISLSTIPNYQIQTVQFKGVTFGGFSGSAIFGNATSVTKVTLDNILLTGFTSQSSVISQQNPAGPFSVVINNSTISSGSSSGNIFSSERGDLELNGVKVTNVDATTLLTVSGSGATAVLNDVAVIGGNYKVS
jgi:hypothetical protein